MKNMERNDGGGEEMVKKTADQLEGGEMKRSNRKRRGRGGGGEKS